MKLPHQQTQCFAGPFVSIHTASWHAWQPRSKFHRGPRQIDVNDWLNVYWSIDGCLIDLFIDRSIGWLVDSLAGWLIDWWFGGFDRLIATLETPRQECKHTWRGSNCRHANLLPKYNPSLVLCAAANTAAKGSIKIRVNADKCFNCYTPLEVMHTAISSSTRFASQLRHTQSHKLPKTHITTHLPSLTPVIGCVSLSNHPVICKSLQVWLQLTC